MKKIIVIEDETDVREDVCTLLTEEGYDVYQAANGREGLNKIKKINPDLIVSDVVMNDKNGYDLKNELQNDKKLKKIPFIFLTAMADRENIRTGMELGADDYILKPFTAEELLRSINLRFEKIYLLSSEGISGESVQGKEFVELEENIFVQTGGKFKRIKVAEIVTIKAENQYSNLQLSDGSSYLVRHSIAYWEEKLPSGEFERIHRSYVINLNFIENIEKLNNSSLLVSLKNISEPIIASKRYSAKLRQKIL